MSPSDGDSTIDHELLIMALEQAGDSVEILDSRMRIMWVNDAFERLHGRTRAEVLGRQPGAVPLGSERFAARHAEAGRALEEGRTWTGEVAAVRPDGSEVMVEMTVSPVREASGRSRGCVAIKRDLSAVMGEQLRHARELEEILDHVPVGVVVHFDGVLRYVNQHAAHMLRVPTSTLVGQSMFSRIHPDDQPGVRERTERTRRDGVIPPPSEIRVLRDDGSILSARVHPAGTLAYRGEDCLCACLEDLAPERRRRESSILEDRMQTIGQIAAGVAHEINNPLTWMIDALDEAQRAPDAVGRIREARDGAERIRHVVRELTLFTRDPAQGDVATEIGEVVRAAVHLSRRTVEASASVRIDGPAEDVWVVGSGPKLGQVCLNLLLNASAAMPSDRRGEVVVSWRVRGDRCRVTIGDDGRGMSPDVMSRAFEPFFTTRAGEGGTGLGLAMCQNIVADLGGAIAIDSELEQGTVVTIDLRIATAPEKVTSEAPPEASPCRVLLVEDQVMVGRALARRMRSMGHHVEHVRDGREAFDRLESERGFDAIVCDLMMPEMSGQELHTAISGRWPPLVNRIVFMTGGAFTEGAREFLQGLDTPWLVKPFEDDELVRALSHVVSRRPASGRPASTRGST